MSDWDESKHPRVPAGSSGGGEFSSGGSGGVPTGSKPSRSSAEYPPKNPSGKDTQERFSDGKGRYTPERRALHAEIIAKALEDTTPVSYPTVTILGGGPASGKSTGLGALENTVHVDSDKTKVQLPEWSEQVGVNKNLAAFVHEESSDVSKEITRAAAESGRNLLLDGTGNGSYSKLSERIEYLRSHDYRVVGKYTVIDPDIAMERMLKRAEKTGRYVPEDFVREVHKGVARVLPAAIKAKLFSSIDVYDNSGASRKLIYSGGRDRDEVIHDKDLWEAFMKRGEQ